MALVRSRIVANKESWHGERFLILFPYFFLGTAGIMESQDYTIWNFNLSKLFQGLCDSLVFILVVLSTGYLLGLPVDGTDMLYVSVYLAFSYAYIRILEVVSPTIKEVCSS